jgi:surfactin synthase thioesterase subunit
VSGRRAPQLPRNRAALHELTEPELIAALMNAELHSDLWKRPHWRDYYFNLIRRDSAAVERIPVQEEAIFDLPIVAFHGTQDQWASKDELAAWRGATRGPFVIRDYEGGHFDHHNARDAIMAEASTLCGCQEGSFA